MSTCDFLHGEVAITTDIEQIEQFSNVPFGVAAGDHREENVAKLGPVERGRTIW